ncbi:hypothetical protein S40285_02563 [Stachybotrys chlorohalonatus IBT 40285]|uniref:CENP-V/GFA domain-containing protein n=1 Tax=Stachybotrys chlorohalonatus (strain IBT 40285) TaxID=1283841 RepID=A0A084QVV9_STAC4|nr:hypothetical protein S40285_02563 [Stachybotrys chlorohalonata IBT 40285]
MPENVKGSCVCGGLRYSLSVDSADDVRTSLCHCSSCRKAFGTNFGLTSKASAASSLADSRQRSCTLTHLKVPLQGFQYESGEPKSFKQDNGVIREFCGNCGAFICEYGEQAADKFRYIIWGTMDEPDKFPPKGEFFCKYRASWMPEIPDVFHKAEIKE